MNKLSKYFFVVMIFSLMSVVAYRYYEYVYRQNFLLETNISCDPATASCFVADCLSEIECDKTPYEKIEILARDAPKCLEEHDCENFSCTEINSCKVTYCSTDSLTEGEKCVTNNIQ